MKLLSIEPEIRVNTIVATEGPEAIAALREVTPDAALRANHKEAKPQSSQTRKEIAMFKINRFMTILACLILIAAFTGCATTGNRESTGQYIDNSVITSKVKTAIFNEPTLKSLQIEVESFKGEVQLSGFVDSVQNVKKAGEIARSIEGVVSVNNDLVVK